MIRKELHLKIDSILFIGAAFSLPLLKSVSLYLLLTIFISWLVEGRFGEKWARMKESFNFKGSWIFFLFPLMYLIGSFNTSDLESNWFELEKKMGLLLMPIVLLSFRPELRTRDFFNKVMIGFILGNFLASVICLISAYLVFSETGNHDAFYYSHLSYFHHAGYFSLYLNVAIIGVLFNIEAFWRKVSLFFKIMMIFMIIFFMLMIVLLSSKAGILSLGITFLLSLSYIVIVRKKFILGLSITLLLLAGGLTALSIFDFSADRLEASRQTLASDSKSQAMNVNDTSAVNGMQVRMIVWEASCDLIIQNPVFGVGTGDYKNEMKARLEEMGLIDKIGGYKNSHNQYLQTAVTLGGIGFILLVLWIVLPFVLAWKKNHYFYMMFLMLVAFNLLVESMLETQSGVVFISFMHAFVYSISVKIGPRL